MNSKPSWDDPNCPDWANWLAMDSSGKCYWYDKKPAKDERGWHEYGWYAFAGYYKIRDWEPSLEKRPEEK